MRKNVRRMNPLRAYFYVAYLELFEFGDPVAIKVFTARLFDLELPLAVQRIAYETKHLAKYCEDRPRELKLMYNLKYTDGYAVKPSPTDKFLYYESLDPDRHTLAQQNLCLFASRPRHNSLTT